MTEQSQQPIASGGSVVKIWPGRGGRPKFALTVAEGTSEVELGELVDRALRAWRRLHEHRIPEEAGDHD